MRNELTISSDELIDLIAENDVYRKDSTLDVCLYIEQSINAPEDRIYNFDNDPPISAEDEIITILTKMVAL